MTLIILLLAGTGLTPRAIEAQPLTESEAVRIGLAVAAWRDFAESSMDAARSRTRAAGRWENPEFEFVDESLDLPGGNTDRFYWLRQPLDLSGRKSLERAAARAGEGVATASIELRERQRAAVVRAAFYRSLRLGHESEAIGLWRDRLEQLGLAVERRVEAGDASRYDRLRIAREQALLEGRLALVDAERIAAREQLFGLLQQSPRTLSGRLLPGPPPDLPAALQALAEHPEVSRLHAAADSDRLSARAAGREAWPEVTLGVGVRELEDGPLSQTGGVFSVGLEVPLFDRGRQRRDAARADAGARSAEAALALSRLESEARALLARLAGLRAEAVSLARSIGNEDESLPAIAEAAWQAGELSVMELIDAWQAELELRLKGIELEFAARAAAIELQRLIGESG